MSAILYIEQYVPVVKYNGGLQTALPVTLENSLTLTGSGVTTLGGSLSVAGMTTFTGGITLENATFQNYTNKAAINATGTATAAQVATGYITSTSAAATTITLPTGTLLGAATGAIKGTTFDLFVDNTGGANTVTIAVAVNGILSSLATSSTTAFGVLTIPSGVTGLGRFTITFTSSTTYVFSRTA